MNSAKYKAICDLKELCRRSMLDIDQKDSDYIVEHINEIFHDMFFIIEDYQRFEATIRLLRATLTANNEWDSVLADKSVLNNENEQQAVKKEEVIK